MSLDVVFRAGCVHRWHTNPDLCHTVDRIDAHQGRVARMMLALWPDCSVPALHYALTHDDGESVVGDAPSTTKGAFDLTRAESVARAAIWPGDVSLSAQELLRIRFCDRLDAYMWARHHAPHVMGGDGWPECAAWLRSVSGDLGVPDAVLSEVLA